MRLLIGGAARGRPEQYKKEIAAVLPAELRDASISFDLSDNADEWGEEIAHCEAIILTSRGLGPTAIQRASKLRFVQKLGIDVARVDVEACRARGVKVSVLPDAGHVAVAEHTVAMILACTRNLISTHAAVVRGENPAELVPIKTTQNKRHVNWLQLPEQDFPLLTDLTLGFVGFGEIARETAQRARGLVSRIVYTKRNRLDASVEREYGVSFKSLDDLLGQADIVSILATQPDDAPPIIGARELGLLRPHAFLINTARGNQVDQAALIRALEANRLRGAALDVFEYEPVLDSKLLELSNVILTPHTANLMPTGRRFRDALANVAALSTNRPLTGLV